MKIVSIMFAVLVAMGTGQAAFGGQLINVDFQPGGAGSDSSVNYSGQGALLDPGNDAWNVVAPDTGGEFNGEFGTGGFFNFDGSIFTSSALLDSEGIPTPVTVSVSKAPVGNPAESERAFAIDSTNINSIVNLATNAVGLMQDFLIARYDGFDENFVIINNLTTGGIYNLVLYGAGDFANRNTKFIVGSTTKTTAGVPEGPHGLTEDQDYVVFNGVVADGGSITITYLNGAEFEEGNFNGFQLQEANPVDFSAVQVSNTAALSFDSISDAVYRLQYNSDLLSTNWITTPIIILGTGGSMVAYDPAGFSTSKVYRIVQE